MIFLRRLLKVFVGFMLAFLLFFITMYFTTKGDHEVMPTVEQHEEATGTEIDGYFFHTQTFGDSGKPEVIVLHGGPGYDFRYMLSLRALANEYRVVFYDQRGSGLSPRVHPDALTTDQAVEDLQSIIEYYSPEEKVYLTGHSWGGLLASHYVARHPGKVEKLALLEPEFLTGDAAKQYFENVNFLRPQFSFKTLATFTISWFESLHVKKPDKQASPDFFMEKLMLSFQQPYHPLYKAICHHEDTLEFTNWRYGAMASGNLIGNLFDAQGNLVFEEINGLKEYKNTVLFVTGDCNQLFGQEFQQHYHLNLFRNARVINIAQAGHFMMLDKRKETIKILRDYFKQEDI
jgi:proline iminopeptidase